MDAVLLKSGSGFDDSSYTATAADVKKGKTFMGSGSSDEQTGTMAVIAAIDKKMVVNELYMIKPGYHNGQDVFHQEGVPVEEGPIVDPGAGGITAHVAGKYLTSDTYIQTVDNLRPETIKKGVIIGFFGTDTAVVGTCEGFFD